MTPAEEGATSGSDADSTTYRLTLFVAGQTARSNNAAAAIRGICARLPGGCEVTIVDVLERPRLAEEEKILATPTVIRRWPLPLRRVIGDLSDVDKVVFGLDLPPLAADSPEENTS